MKRVLVILVLICFASSLFALESVKDIVTTLNSDEYSVLLSGELLSQNTTDGDISHIAPPSVSIKEKIDYVLGMKKGFGVAISSLLSYPEGWNEMNEEEQILKLYNTLLSISTQKDLTYISHRAGDKEKTLFEDSSMLSSSNKKDRIEDPTVTVVPNYAEYYAYQKDTSFGGNVYLLKYKVEENEIFMEISNYSELKFMGIGLVAPGKVNMALDIIPTEEGIYVYAMASVKDKTPKINLVFYSVDLELSFYNRIVALRNWLNQELNK